MYVTVFDSLYYLWKYTDVRQAVAIGLFPSSWAHYQLYGAAEHRNPNAMFDGAYYYVHNPDVAVAVQRGQFPSTFAHYVTFGLAEGRLPSAQFAEFDEHAYLEANEDVATAVKLGMFSCGLHHFLAFGRSEMAEGRRETDGVPATLLAPLPAAPPPQQQGALPTVTAPTPFPIAPKITPEGGEKEPHGAPVITVERGITKVILTTGHDRVDRSTTLGPVHFIGEIVGSHETFSAAADTLIGSASLDDRLKLTVKNPQVDDVRLAFDNIRDIETVVIDDNTEPPSTPHQYRFENSVGVKAVVVTGSHPVSIGGLQPGSTVNKITVNNANSDIFIFATSADNKKRTAADAKATAGVISDFNKDVDVIHCAAAHRTTSVAGSTVEAKLVAASRFSQGTASVFVDGDDSWLFVSDRNLGITGGDVVVKLENVRLTGLSVHDHGTLSFG